MSANLPTGKVVNHVSWYIKEQKNFHIGYRMIIAETVFEITDFILGIPVWTPIDE